MREFMMTLLTCSLTMSVLALLYMAFTPLLARRYAEKGRYYVWLIIVLGLIIPFRPQFKQAIIQVDVLGEMVDTIIQTGTRAIDAAVTRPTSIGNDLPPLALSIDWWWIVVVVWLAGMVIFIAYHAIKHRRFLKMVRRWSENVADEQTLTLLKSLESEFKLARPISLGLCASIGSPMMIGFIAPRILIPKGSFTQDELRFILKHELVHYKRKDLWYKCLVLIATAIHWFNPIVYLMAKAIHIQCELSCDTEVIAGTGIHSRQYYSETIISVLRYQSKQKTVLSTNFYGGKEGMKKRIISIMDMSRKKTGFVVICGVLILTMGMGFAFATNAVSVSPQANANTTVFEAQKAQDTSTRYEQYAEFGLLYDSSADCLYYNRELVRYFEDWYPVGEDGTAFAGSDYFNENGTVDVHGIRDLTSITRNPDGSYDPSGKLIGVAPYSQAEFEERDIEPLMNPQAYFSFSTVEYATETNNDGNSPNFTLSEESRESFKIYSEFGLTYDNDEVFRFKGKTVRRFADLEGGMAFTRTVPNDYDKSVDLIAVRDASGNLIGLSQANREEFEERTKSIEQSLQEREAFLQSHPNVTAYSTVETGKSETAIISDAAATYASTNQVTLINERDTTYATSDQPNYIDTSLSDYLNDGISSETAIISDAAATYASTNQVTLINERDTTYATSDQPNYIDTSLSDYLNDGISYDQLSGTWIFNGKPIAFLVDPGYQIYANFAGNHTDTDFAEKVRASNSVFLKVIRKADGSIDGIMMMSADEAVKTIQDTLR